MKGILQLQFLYWTEFHGVEERKGNNVFNSNRTHIKLLVPSPVGKPAGELSLISHSVLGEQRVEPESSSA